MGTAGNISRASAGVGEDPGGRVAAEDPHGSIHDRKPPSAAGVYAGHFFVGLMHTVLGDLQSAEDSFNAATDVHERFGAPAFTAVTKAAHGHVLSEIDSQRAGALLGEAHDLATTLGLQGVAYMTSSGP